MKTIIKNICGERLYSIIRSTICWIIHIGKGKLVTNYDYCLFSQKGKHVFFGYYDLPQFSKNEQTILVHTVPSHCDPKEEDAQIGIYFIDTKQYEPITTTRTWCWQQGSRLRWHPKKKQCILYNDMENRHYVSHVLNIEKRQIERTYDRALYDIATDFTYGLSLNFSRLQRLRPGYGYSRLYDETQEEIAPDKDGIFFVDLVSGESKLFISLKQLAEQAPSFGKYEHYVNHISICPNGKYFIFFHIMKSVEKNDRKTRLYVAEAISGNIVLLEEEYVVSHYCWKDNRNLIVTCIDNGRQFYVHINVETLEREVFFDSLLTEDGHPSFLDNSNDLISDTYPDRNCMQSLFKLTGSDESAKIENIAQLYHNPFIKDEKRCDLHPRISSSNKYICVDSILLNGKRSCVLFDIG